MLDRIPRHQQIDAFFFRFFHVIARSRCDEAIHRAAYAAMDCFAHRTALCAVRWLAMTVDDVDMIRTSKITELVAALAGDDLQTLSLRALVLDLEIASHRFGADVERVAFAGLAIGQYPQLVGGAVELGLIVDDDGRARLSRQSGKPALRGQILIEMRDVVGEIEFRAAGIDGCQRLALIMDLENAGNGPGRVSGREIKCNRAIADRDLHAVNGNDVRLRLAGRPISVACRRRR